MGIFKRKKEEESKETGEEKQKSMSMKDLYSSGRDTKEDKKEKTETKAKKGRAASKGESKKSPQKTPQIAYRVILKPLMTEKVNDLGAENKYVFQVARNANKIEVAKAVKEVYNVTPEKVNIMSMKGKNVRFGRMYGKRSDWKKAVVKLPKGKTISVHEGV